MGWWEMARKMGCAECQSRTESETAKYKCEMCGELFDINYCRQKDGFLCFHREFGLCENCLNKLEFLDHCKRKKYGIDYKEKDEEYMKLEQLVAFDKNKVIFDNNLKGENVMTNFEQTRQKHKPNKVKILFVGESVPSRGTFFYNENSHLYYNTKESFERANIKFSLDKFRELGCWLYDVCKEPVGGLLPSVKKEKIKQGLPDLIKTLKELKPEFVIVIKKGEMKKYIFDEICQKNIVDEKTAFNLPFPACGNQGKYKDELSQILAKIL